MVSGPLVADSGKAAAFEPNWPILGNSGRFQVEFGWVEFGPGVRGPSHSGVDDGPIRLLFGSASHQIGACVARDPRSSTNFGRIRPGLGQSRVTSTGVGPIWAKDLACTPQKDAWPLVLERELSSLAWVCPGRRLSTGSRWCKSSMTGPEFDQPDTRPKTGAEIGRLSAFPAPMLVMEGRDPPGPESTKFGPTSANFDRN